MTEQQSKNTRSLTALVAHLISDLFMPMLVPVYGMVVALWLTPLRMLPLANRLSALFGVTFITAVIPLAFIITMMRLGKISDASISDPRQRTLPYCVTILCYIAAGIFLAHLKAPLWMPVFFGGAALVSLIALMITKVWKISAHTGGVGGLAAFIFWLATRGFIVDAPLAWVSCAFALVGLMAWSRLYLERHTLGQVAAGAALSFAVMLGTIMLIS